MYYISLGTHFNVYSHEIKFRQVHIIVRGYLHVPQSWKIKLPV